jgi:hypothetical protein
MALQRMLRPPSRRRARASGLVAVFLLCHLAAPVTGPAEAQLPPTAPLAGPLDDGPVREVAVSEGAFADEPRRAAVFGEASVAQREAVGAPPAAPPSERSALDDAGRAAPAVSVQDQIVDASARWGLTSAVMLRIARCESGFDPQAHNLRSGAAGVFQFVPATWASTPQGRAGRSVFDAEANVEAAHWLMTQFGPGHWRCT